MLAFETENQSKYRNSGTVKRAHGVQAFNKCL